ncbi:hypothetical protein Ga0123462_0835 [Mariprofundus ferrinatatus]|uniref:Uncharacterized protein n=2 Tax=Mariprofundus ferrinatatus TaxID=1921087 RepID=A0A2K8L9T6_9PROT|nr:hypothetical protein Ga0123462_0835 [Mariprofundus ferrinatatus]
MPSKEFLCIQAANKFRVKHARGKFEKLWVIVCQYKQGVTALPLPEAKTVLNLWHLHGIERRKYGQCNPVELLNQWLDILYGEGTADKLDIEGRCSQIGQRHARVNIPYYTEENAPHFYFRNPFDCILEQLSAELSGYE